MSNSQPTTHEMPQIVDPVNGSMQPQAAGLPLPKLRSEEANDMLERPPSWLLRWGVLSVLGVLLLLLAVAYFLHYPDTLEGKATLSTDPLPIRLKTQGGRIFRLMAADGAPVHSGEAVAEMENATGYENIRRLEALTDSTLACLQRSDLNGLDRILQQQLYALGEAQDFYNSLLQNISALLLLRREQIYARRAGNLQQQSRSYHDVSAVTGEEAALIDEELQQAAERFAANERLYSEKVISRQEYYDEAERLRQKKLSLEQQRREMLQNNISISGNDQQLLELSYDHAEKERTLRTAIEESVRNLRNYLQSWHLRYLLVAPYEGRLRYLRPLQPNEMTSQGEELFAVVPAHFRYQAQVSVPASGLGKIRKGQPVHLLMDQFPYNEYGYLEGQVSEVSSLPQPENMENGREESTVSYRVYVSLPDALVTSYHHRLPFSPEMSGTARIITRDRSLLQRLMAGVMAGNK